MQRLWNDIFNIGSLEQMALSGIDYLIMAIP